MLHDLLKELHDKSLDHLEQLKFEKGDEFSRTIIALYCAIVEHSWSFWALVDQQLEAGTGSIQRSILEAFVDVTNLLADPRYLNHLKAAQHKEWLKFLYEGAKETNPFLDGMAKVANLKANIEEHKTKLKELKAAGFEPLKAWKAFDMAGMGEVYRSIYIHLCMISHNNINALIARHFEINNEIDYTIGLYRPLDLASFEADLDTVAGALIGSGVGIHRHFGSPAASALEALQDKLKAYRKARDGS